MLTVIDVLVTAHLITPALVLLYSAVDVASWLDSREPDAHAKQRFPGWVSKYLLKGGTLDCTAMELYGARCGIVHNFTAESSVNRGGKVRQIVYAYGTSSPNTLNEMSERTHMPFVAVKVEDLVSAFRRGLQTFLDEVAMDSRRTERLNSRAGKVFARMSEEDGQALLRWTREMLAGDRLTGS
jgi:hypothetical protein